jgi:hypothetical protein
MLVDFVAADQLGLVEARSPSSPISHLYTAVVSGDVGLIEV